MAPDRGCAGGGDRGVGGPPASRRPDAVARVAGGLRCLDVGTMNGFWAFELDRRGAGEGGGDRLRRCRASGLAPAERRQAATPRSGCAGGPWARPPSRALRRWVGAADEAVLRRSGWPSQESLARAFLAHASRDAAWELRHVPEGEFERPLDELSRLLEFDLSPHAEFPKLLPPRTIRTPRRSRSPSR